MVQSLLPWKGRAGREHLHGNGMGLEERLSLELGCSSLSTKSTRNRGIPA